MDEEACRLVVKDRSTGGAFAPAVFGLIYPVLRHDPGRERRREARLDEPMVPVDDRRTGDVTPELWSRSIWLGPVHAVL